MPSPTDRPHDQAPSDVPLAGISRADAAIYIGDMAASLRQIALGCDLQHIARLLGSVEAEARAEGRGARQKARGTARN